MKVKRLYVTQALVNKDYKNSFDSESHFLEYDPVLHAYIIDKVVVVHLHNIREVVIEDETIPLTLEDSVHEVVAAPVKKTWSRKKKLPVE